MGRPRLYKEQRVATAIRLPVSLRGQLLKVATERDVSVNLLVTRAISDYLRRLRPVDENDEGKPGRGPSRRASTERT